LASFETRNETPWNLLSRPDCLGKHKFQARCRAEKHDNHGGIEIERQIADADYRDQLRSGQHLPISQTKTISPTVILKGVSLFNTRAGASTSQLRRVLPRGVSGAHAMTQRAINNIAVNGSMVMCRRAYLSDRPGNLLRLSP
jgi:hypothetical protein